MKDATTETKTYTGSCHCQAVRFKAQLALDGAMACNCSLCSRAGWALAFVGADQFELLTPEDNTQDYQFGKKSTHHLFCKTCGVRAYGWGVGPGGERMMSLNLRCVDGVDLKAIPLQEYDGASL